MGNTCTTKQKSRSISNLSEKKFASTPSLSIQESSTISLSDGITLVWLDEYADDSSSENTKYTRTYLRQLNVTSIQPFTDSNSFFKFIESISNDKNIQSSKIYLIVSGTLSIQVLPKLTSYPIVDSVFIYCMDKSKYIPLIQEYEPLIIDICTEIDELYKSIDKQLDELNQSTLALSFFAQEQNTTRNLTKDFASFLWFQLFQLVISELKCTDNEMNIMLKYCSTKLKNDTKFKEMLSQIESFRKTYTSNRAIFWYTKESFVYRLLNAALRTEDFEALYIFRFFLADLCQQLKIEHKKLRIKQSHSPILKVYRGGHISNQELDNLKTTVGSLISLNGFISTSTDLTVAMNFIQKQKTTQNGAEKVLFIIEVDTLSEHIICADVAEISAMQSENEVLFNMGTVFYLSEIIFDNNTQIWHVHLKATEDGIKAANDYIQLTRRELSDMNESIIFGQLFLHIGNFTMAQKYFFDLHQHLKENDKDLPSVLYHLGLTYGYQGDFDKAEDYLKEVNQHHICARSHNLDFARTRNALGWIYYQSGELDKAMLSYEEAAIFAADPLESKHLINGQTYSLMGDCYLERHMFDEAKSCYQHALAIEYLHLPCDHPRIGLTLNDLGDVFRKRKEMKSALEYYEKAELIFQQKLPSHHPYTAYCWSCIGFICLYNGKIEKAQEYHKKALKIYQRILPFNHANIKISEKNSYCTSFEKINDTYLKICARI
ncbi:unnamed protein product [Adineta steineri]|uniref:NAD(P)(+)--arginine ADP-ribosyltransferase n=1 Tax=Adineta steineri TaxID=433720 RepID=A0A819P8X7_9BILA|nr:unnamed protein product [Adineta steineri]